MAKLLYLDASALVKRYIPEIGSNVVDHAFATISHDRFLVLTVGLLEVTSILVRKRNGGVLSASSYSNAVGQLDLEIVKSALITFVQADDLLAFDSLPYIEQYSINSTDAILLRSALDFASIERAIGDDVILVSSDRRLISAAQAEGLLTFNPETQTTTELDALIGP